MVSQKNAQQSAGLKKYLNRSSGVVRAAGHGSTLRNEWGDAVEIDVKGRKEDGSSQTEVIRLRKGFFFLNNNNKWLGENDEFRSAGPCDLYPLLFKELVKCIDRATITYYF